MRDIRTVRALQREDSKRKRANRWFCGPGRTVERENRGFVGPDARWSVKTRGFVDPVEVDPSGQWGGADRNSRKSKRRVQIFS